MLIATIFLSIPASTITIFSFELLLFQSDEIPSIICPDLIPAFYYEAIGYGPLPSWIADKALLIATKVKIIKKGCFEPIFISY